MKRQKGQAIILVLIFLAVGALVVVPTLSFAGSGLRSQRISEDALTRLYAADSAIEDALWQLINSLMGTFDPNNPQPVSYDFEFSSGAHVTIQIPSVPASEDFGSANVHIIVDVVPNWAETPPGGGSYTFNYVVRFTASTWSLTNFKYSLPHGLTYTDPSTYYQNSPSQGDTPAKNAELAYDAEVDLANPIQPKAKLKNGQWGNMTLKNYVVVNEWPPPGGAQPNTSYLIITTETDGRQTLEWKPYFSGNTSGQRTFLQTIEVTGTPPAGINYLSNVTFQGGFGTLTAPPPGTGAMGVAMYTVLVQLGGVTYQVIVAYDSTTGTFKIISYQQL